MTSPYTRIPRPRILIPAHRLTWCALNGAAMLADLLEPITEAEREAQQRILQAARSGNLITTYHLVNDYRKSRHISTQIWRDEFAIDWLRKCQRHIFDEVRQQLTSEQEAENRDQRREWAIQMRQEGMSYRRIAEELGVDPMTIRNDIQKSGVEGSTPDQVTGKDGKTYPAHDQDRE